MNIWVNFPMLGKMVKIWHFLVFLKELFFQLISTVLKRFWPGNYKNVFVLVLAHLKPELELFEVREILLLQIIITIIVNVINFKQL